jgi:hypothetical protein
LGKSGKNSLSLEQPAGLPQTPWRGLPSGFDRNGDQNLSFSEIDPFTWGMD